MSDPTLNLKPRVSPEDFFREAPAPDYSSMAREAAARYRVDPQIFERQIAHESINYNPDVVAGRRNSPAGAIGIAQFMPETAARYGLHGPDLHDPVKSLDAAARHMRDLLDDTDDDYEAALAGYNAGIGRVRDGSWRNISETRNYTKKILGAAQQGLKPKVDPDAFFANMGTPSQVTAPRPSGFDLRPERFTLAPPRRLSGQAGGFNFESIRQKAEPAPAEQPTARPPLRARSGKSDRWNQQQADMATRATEAGLPQTTDSRQRLIDSIKRSEQAGYKTPHFIGSPNEPTGDRGVTRDIETLVSSLKAQEAATPVGPARDAISRQRAYWEQELSEGMTAQEWKAQTGAPEPRYPGQFTRQSARDLMAAERGQPGEFDWKALRDRPRAPAQQGQFTRQSAKDMMAAERQDAMGAPISVNTGRPVPRLRARRTPDRPPPNEAFERAMTPGPLTDIPKSIIQGAVGATLDVPAYLAEIVGDTPSSQAIRGFIEEVRSDVKNALPIERPESFFTSELPQAAGSSIPFMAASILAPEAQAARIVAGLGAAQNGHQIYQEARNAGQSHEDALRASIYGAAIGTTERFGLGAIGSRMGKATALEAIKHEFLEEGGQETLTAFLNNATARGFYDPHRELDRDVVKSAIIGAITGGVMGGGAHAIARGAARSPAAQPEVIPSEVTPPTVTPSEVGGSEPSNTPPPGTPIVNTPLNASVDSATVRAEVQDEIGRVIAGEMAAAGGVPQFAESAVTDHVSQTPELPQEAQNRPESVSGALEPAPGASGTVQPTPEAPETLLAQLQALREGRGSRKAVLVTDGEQMPATKGALENEGIAVTKTPEGTFLHSPRVVSRKAVKQMAADGSYHSLLGIVEPKGPTTGEAVVARDEAGTELQAALASPENVTAQGMELQAQFPDAQVGVEQPEQVIAGRDDEQKLAALGALRDEEGNLPRASIVQRSLDIPFREAERLVTTYAKPEAKPGPTTTAVPIEPTDAAAHDAATSPLNETAPPTEGQKAAGNYKKGHVQIGGLDVSIENPEGTKRKPEWPTLKSHYGYLRGTESRDKEQVDVFVKPGTTPDYAGPVFVVDQSKASGEFDEHKTMLGWPDEAAARAAYAENYTPGWKVGPIRRFGSVSEFQEWLKTADTTKPATEAGTKSAPTSKTETPQAAATPIVAPAKQVDKQPPKGFRYDESGALVEKRRAAPTGGKGDAEMTLSQFVRSKGGFKEDADLKGELRRLRPRESGSTGLVTKTGLSPDRMREAAVEAGFFNPDDAEAQNVGDFVYAVERDLAGDTVRSSEYDPSDDLDRDYDQWRSEQVGFRVSKFEKALDNYEDFTDAFDRLQQAQAPTEQDLARFRKVARRRGFEPDEIENILRETTGPPLGEIESEGEEGSLEFPEVPSGERRTGKQEDSVARLSTDEVDRVRELYRSLQEQSLSVGEYLRQGGLFGEQLSEPQKDLLRELDDKTRRAPISEKQTSLLETAPTLESRVAEKEEKAKRPRLTSGGGSVFGDPLPKPSEREPWQMTRDEMVASRVAAIEKQIAELPKAQRIPGNLTRRKDRSDLRIASEGARVYERHQSLLKRIDQVKSPEAQDAITQIHRERVEKAVREGKPVPSRVLGEYPDLAAQVASKKAKRPRLASGVSGVLGMPEQAVTGVVVYHGTNANTSSGLDPANAQAIKGVVFFTDSPEDAGRFTGSQYGPRVGEGANIVRTKLSLNNPAVYDFGGKLFDFKKVRSFIVRAQGDGKDGVIIRNIKNFPDSKPSTTYVSFDKPKRPRLTSSGSGTLGMPLESGGLSETPSMGEAPHHSELQPRTADGQFSPGPPEAPGAISWPLDPVTADVNDVHDFEAMSATAPVRMPMALAAQVEGRVSSTDVIRSYEKVLSAAGRTVPVRVGRFRQRARGIFKVEPEVIRLQTANNIPTASHEIGHALSKALYKTAKSKAMRRVLPAAATKELVDLGKALYGSTQPAGGYTQEGFAEFMRFYLTRDDVQQVAPAMYRFFTEQVLPSEPKISAALDAAREATDTYRQEGAENRALANIDRGPNLKERIQKAFRALRKVPTYMVDEFTPLLKLSEAAERQIGRKLEAEHDPFIVGSFLRGNAPALTHYMVFDGMVDLARNRTGPSLSEALAPVRYQKERFTAYLWARRAQERLAQGKNPGMTQEDADALVLDLGTAEFQLAADAVYRWNEGILNYVKQTVPDLAPSVDAILAQSSNYVPLSRAFDDVDADMVQRLNRQAGGNPLKRMKGSGRRVKDIFPQMVANAERMIAMAHRRRLMDTIVKLGDVEGMGHLIEEVPKDMVGQSQEIERLVKQLEQAGADMSRVNLDELITFFTPAHFPKGKDPILPAMKGGQMHWYQVSPDLYATLSGLDMYRLPKVLDLLLGVPTRAFRLGTTGLRAAFSLVTNPLRDAPTFVMQTRAHANPARLVGEYLGALAETANPTRLAGKRGEYFDLFYRLGANLAQPLGQDIAVTRKAAKGLFRNRTARIVTSPIDALRELFSAPEATPRIAELRLLADEVGWDGQSPLTFDQAVQLGLGAKQVTTDFTAAGRAGKVINQMVPFFNASIQGSRSFARAFKRRPLRTVLMGLTSLTIPTLLLWWQHKDEEWYKELDDREKFLYWHFKIGDKILQIPRPFEWGNVFATAPEAIFDSWYRKDPEGLKGAAGHLFETTTPEVLPHILQVAKEQWQNRIEFFDQPIVPRAEQDLPPGEQRGPYTSRVAEWVGRSFPDQISPRRVDHLIRSLGGGALPDTLNLVGIGSRKPSRESEASDIPVLGRLFARGGTDVIDRSMNKFYEAYSKAQSHALSKDRPETEEGKRRRLQMEDAAKALKLLALTARDLPKSEDRKEVHDKMLDVARRALGGGYAGVGDIVGPIPPEIKDPVERELSRLGIRLTFPSKKLTIDNEEQEVPQAKFENFQREMVGGLYENLAAMIAKPDYGKLSDKDKALVVDSFKQAWSENERRRLRAQTMLEMGATGRTRFEAEKAIRGSDEKARELKDADRFLDRRAYEKRKRPRLTFEAPAEQ